MQSFFPQGFAQFCRARKDLAMAAVADWAVAVAMGLDVITDGQCEGFKGGLVTIGILTRQDVFDIMECACFQNQN